MDKIKLTRLALFSLVIFAFAAARVRAESSVFAALFTTGIGLSIGVLIFFGFIFKGYRYLSLAFIYITLFGIIELLTAGSAISTEKASPFIVVLALALVPVAAFAMHGRPKNLT